MATSKVDETTAIDKLPLWARHRIRKLEGDIAYYKEMLAEVGGNPGSSPVYIKLYDHPQNTMINLPYEATICFNLNGNEIGIKLKRDHNDVPYLYVMATGVGDVSIRPSSSNTFTIQIEGRNVRSG
jgi:hypothetical protein